MKKSHPFNLRSVFSLLCLSVVPFLSTAQSVESYPLYPENSTPIECEVTGEFVMEFTWNGTASSIDVIKWSNSSSSSTGSAYLEIQDANKTVLWSGYPEEISEDLHGFYASGIIFQPGQEYRLVFDLSQVDVSVYTQTIFPWSPSANGPVDVITTELTGIINNPVDPDYIFPYFTLNMIHSVSVDEEDELETWTPHPNPASSYINMPDIDGDYTARLIDLSGKVVINRKMSASDERLDLSGLNSGVYLLQLVNEDEVLTNSRLVIE